MKLFNRKKNVFCYHCGEEMTVSARAFSVNCPRCHQRVSVDDQVVSTIRSQPHIETCGSMKVTETGKLRARLTVYDLNVAGQILGSITAGGKVTLDEGASIIGNITARSLTVQKGASINGFCRIEPTAAQKDTLAKGENQPVEE